MRHRNSPRWLNEGRFRHYQGYLYESDRDIGELGETVVDALYDRGFEVRHYRIEDGDIWFECRDSDGRHLRYPTYDEAENVIIGTCKKYGYKVRDDGPGIFHVFKGSTKVCTILMNQDY